MAKTLREKFIIALTARGEKEVKRTSKYIVFSRQYGGFYYLGSSGAIRFGATSTGSIPVNESLKNMMLEEANAA